MNVVLSFDVEVWCDGWTRLDERFPAAFSRYVWGRSPQGDYALPRTLEIMARHGLRGVFFVEPLFAARFGVEHLATIVNLIRQGGQDVQLHLHPEWTDEIQPCPLPGVSHKRQYLSMYSQGEQTQLIALGLDLLAQVGVPAVSAFRAGSFACNAATFHALEANDLMIDSSLNACYAVSGEDLAVQVDRLWPSRIGAVQSFPVATFLDSAGKRRPAQVAGCGAAEMVEALQGASKGGCHTFVIVSHNFELLRPGGSTPDGVVVRRFERLCAFLGRHQREMPTVTYSHCSADTAKPWCTPQAAWSSTATRWGEQAWRRGRDAIASALRPAGA